METQVYSERSLVFSVTKEHVARIKAAEAQIVGFFQRSLESHQGHIAEELATIATFPEQARAQAALVFSIMSPRCPFAKNVKLTRLVLDHILSGEDVTPRSLYDIIGAEIGLARQKSLRLWSASEVIRNLKPEHINRATLMQIDGVAWKASAMTIHLTNPHAHVWTLDVHELRGLLRLAEIEIPTFGVVKSGKYKGEVRPIRGITITDAAYAELERWLLTICDEEFHGIAPFVIQWATWNDFGFKGVHQNHTPIFTGELN